MDKEFNDLVFKVLDKFPQRLSIVMLRNFLKASVAINPEYLLKEVGPFFFKFRVEIAAGTIEALAKHDYADQIKDWVRIPFLVTIAEALRDTIRETVTAQIKADSEECVNTCRTLLALYCKHQLSKIEVATKNDVSP